MVYMCSICVKALYVIGQKKSSKLKAAFFDQSQTTHYVEMYVNAAHLELRIIYGKKTK